MTILKSEEILCDSPRSWEDATASAVARFAKTVRNVRSAYVNSLSTVVENGRVAAWRVNLQVTFEVDEPAAPAKTSKTKAKSKSKAKK
jgi:flavin-binding protein dodecin